MGTWYFAIDLNSRNEDGHMVARFHVPKPGDVAIGYEPEDGVEIPGYVHAVYPEQDLVILDLDWDKIRRSPEAE